MTGQDTAPVLFRHLAYTRKLVSWPKGGLQVFVLPRSRLTTRGEAHEMLAAIKGLSRQDDCVHPTLWLGRASKLTSLQVSIRLSFQPPVLEPSTANASTAGDTERSALFRPFG